LVKAQNEFQILTGDREVGGVREQLFAETAPLLHDSTNGGGFTGGGGGVVKGHNLEGEVARAARSGTHATGSLDSEDALPVGVAYLVPGNPAGFRLVYAPDGGAGWRLDLNTRRAAVLVGAPAATSTTLEWSDDAHHLFSSVVENVHLKAALGTAADSHAKIRLFVCVEALLTQTVFDDEFVFRLDPGECFEQLHLLVYKQLIQ